MDYPVLQDGKIEAEVKLTGILSVGALHPGEVRKYGTTIAPGLYAPVHQHFFVAHMDMEVDCKPGEALNQVNHKIMRLLASLLFVLLLMDPLHHSACISCLSFGIQVASA